MVDWAFQWVLMCGFWYGFLESSLNDIAVGIDICRR